jgi:hypothetical protein
MLRLLVAWGLFRLFRVALAASVVLALGLALLHGLPAAQHALSGPGLSKLGHELQHGVQGALQHALRPVPGTR